MTEKEIDTLMNLPLACFRSDGVLAVQAKKKAQAREEADREEKILWARELEARELAEREAIREAAVYSRPNARPLAPWSAAKVVNPLCFWVEY